MNFIEKCFGMKLLRWLLVLPAAVGAAGILNVLGYILAGASQENIFNEENVILRLLFLFMWSLFTGTVFVFFGASVAPKHRAACARALTIILIAGLILVYFKAPEKYQTWRMIVSFTLASWGALVASYYAAHELDNATPDPKQGKN